MLLKRVPLFLRILRSVRIILFLRAPRCSCLHLLHQVDGCWTTLFLQPPVCISTISCWVCRIMTRTVTKILHFYILQVEGRKHLIIIDVLPHAKILWLHNEPWDAWLVNPPAFFREHHVREPQKKKSGARIPSGSSWRQIFYSDATYVAEPGTAGGPGATSMTWHLTDHYIVGLCSDPGDRLPDALLEKSGLSASTSNLQSHQARRLTAWIGGHMCWTLLLEGSC